MFTPATDADIVILAGDIGHVHMLRCNGQARLTTDEFDTLRRLTGAVLTRIKTITDLNLFVDNRAAIYPDHTPEGRLLKLLLLNFRLKTED